MTSDSLPPDTGTSAAIAWPVPAASAVLLRNDSVLLVQRALAPNAGYWSFPGGKMHAGETVEQAALRELNEETGVKARADTVLTALDVMEYNGSSLQYHYLLVVIYCHWLSGIPRAADDAADARWISIQQLRRGDYPLTDSVLPVLELALQHRA
ncbi:NUDIX hydrolase [Marinobacterium rhizophilum]|uniref:NUDIX hydrolase n=1 Tax=Marinobacterium rhizophilum TaxID=420402 RepID=A0ABY5HKS9_9GAMM|nr:NUDIX hydrolase [Marinobacterium rhizophilum]UTW13002.1 NUDIX hydrolase [Marinobacterium rhizophilum]